MVDARFVWLAGLIMLGLAAQVSSAELPAYDRSTWSHWIDVDGDCQSTRVEVLIRDAEYVVLDATGCKVREGLWVDPYGGGLYRDSSDIDIEHIVPLHEAHVSGGAAWSRDQKREFANDPVNLIAVRDRINQARGHKRPDEWRPPRPDYWCVWSTRYEQTKSKYGLSMTPREKLAIEIMLETCLR